MNKDAFRFKGDLLKITKKYIKENNLRRKTRKREKVIKLKAFIYFLRKKYNATFLYLGSLLNLHHATIIHHFNDVNDILNNKEIYKRYYNKIIKDIEKALVSVEDYFLFYSNNSILINSESKIKKYLKNKVFEYSQIKELRIDIKIIEDIINSFSRIDDKELKFYFFISFSSLLEKYDFLIINNFMLDIMDISSYIKEKYKNNIIFNISL